MNKNKNKELSYPLKIDKGCQIDPRKEAVGTMADNSIFTLSSE